jgi:hypothetical protein
MKAYWGSGSTVPRILELDTRWRWVVSFKPQPLYSQGKSPWYPLDRSLGGPHSRSGRDGEEKNSQPPPWLGPSIIQPVAQRCTTELTRLHKELGQKRKKWTWHSLITPKLFWPGPSAVIRIQWMKVQFSSSSLFLSSIMLRGLSWFHIFHLLIRRLIDLCPFGW